MCAYICSLVLFVFIWERLEFLWPCFKYVLSSHHHVSGSVEWKSVVKYNLNNFIRVLVKTLLHRKTQLRDIALLSRINKYPLHCCQLMKNKGTSQNEYPISNISRVYCSHSNPIRSSTITFTVINEQLWSWHLFAKGNSLLINSI